MSVKEQAIEVLTTHRHGENQEACDWCASFYGKIVDKLMEAGLL